MTTNNSINLGDSGLSSYDGSGTFSGVTITGTTDFIDVTNGDGIAGDPTLNVASNFETTGMHGWNSSVIEVMSVTAASDGATITLSVEKEGGGDLTVVFSDGYYAWDTSPADTVTLTAGTDTTPILNYVYFLQSTKTLTANTSGFPSEENAPIATILCQSASSFQTNGSYKLDAWNDDLTDDDQNGHISHINGWIRSQNATWKSGVDPTLTITVNGGIPDNVIFTSTSGIVNHLHEHTFPAFSGTPDIYTVNDSVTPFNIVTDLNELLTDSIGGSMTARRFSLVIWGVQSESSSDCKLMVNLPSGTYGTNAALIADDSKFTDFSIPSEFIGAGFLIAQYNLRHQNVSGGTWTIISEVNLRGLFPSISAGAGTVAGSSFDDSVFNIFDDGDNTKAIAFDAASITTATTRTLTVQDANGTIALTNDFSTALPLGNTLANTVEATNLTVDPASASDSFLQFDESTVAKWRVGNDETDDSYRISQGSSLGTNDVFTVSTGGQRFLPLQTKFLARLETEITDATGDGTVVAAIIYDTEDFDLGGNYDTSTGIFTAPVVGTYFFTVGMGLGGIAGTQSSYISNMAFSVHESFRLGESDIGSLRSVSDIWSGTYSIMVELEASETVQVNIVVSGTPKSIDLLGASGGTYLNYFGGYLLG